MLARSGDGPYSWVYMSDGMNGSADRALVEERFLEALDLPTGKREAYLQARCGDDPAVLAEVRSLLASYDAPGFVPEMADERPFGGRYPERIGEYRIVRPLGEGGMGVVLLAIREGPGFEQTVALKLIRGRFVDPFFARRLEEERRILALLEHPGIARLVDGGVTPDGEPYFAMEYVRGEDILAYCDTRQLPLEERLELFLQVCDAVHHAHQQLVVHRDLKPSNIMVTPEGRPKLLDFGIARNMEAVTTVEQTAQWVTPAYASPEQITGGVVSTLSDVYALGILLCELLSGARPYSTSNLSPGELTRTVAQDPPRRPSELVAGEMARNRRSTAQRLSRVLRGDLDQIVLKVLAKEPHRRYESAWALAEDLRRFLAGRPVHARPDTLRYRATKFVGRHRGLVGLGAMLVLALVGGVGGVVWQARQAAAQRDRAEVEAARARQVTALMTDIFRLGDPAQALGDTIGVRQVLAEGARRVDQGLSDDPVLQATLFLELARIYRNLGILAEAERLGARALSLRAEHEPESVAHADALGFQGLVLRDVGRPRESQALLEEAIALRERAVQAPDTALATLLSGLGWEIRAEGDYERARALFTRALEIQRQALGDDHPAVANSTLGVAATFHDEGSFDRAEELFRVTLAERRAEPSPVVASALVNLGMVQRLRERFREAEPLLRAGLEMRSGLLDAQHPDVMEAREQLAMCLAALGRYGEAEPYLRENLETAVRVLGEEHEQTRGSREALAMIDHDLGRFTLAAARLDSVVAAKVRAHRGDHPGAVFTLASAGDAFLEAGRTAEAEARYLDALAMAKRLGVDQGTYSALARHGLARVALARGRTAAADSLSEAALDQALAGLRPGHRYVLEMQRTRARAFLALGRAGEADALLADVLAGEEAVRPHPHPRIGATMVLQGEVRRAVGDDAGARDAWRKARDEVATLPPTHPLRRQLDALLAGGSR